LRSNIQLKFDIVLGDGISALVFGQIPSHQGADSPGGLPSAGLCPD